ncbi:hypothetical protein [Marinimicrobium sp. ABcell2]|uniref:hypothetical protein n=1 Tax=Marinimicrobium sp. ABcell2 TaxID=3069751 RepID=UPI0027B42AF9|nr:hypothetical protein [Marinimicrobium sp. ABcell2]MDQ2078531.1 hypothetical protein [Marinimicrobium sp. ABcell2]
MPVTLTRTVLVILIPGGIALVSWILLYLLKVDTESADSFYQLYSMPINLCFFAAVVIIGTIIEGANTHLEVRWDNKREEEYDVENNWYAYLSCTPSSEPVAFKYFTRLVTTMYFELGMMWATLSFGLGVASIICTLKPSYYTLYSLVTVVFSILLAIYLYFQASTSHEVLCKARKELIGRLKC